MRVLDILGEKEEDLLRETDECSILATPQHNPNPELISTIIALLSSGDVAEKST
jgi:hypothetical protein